MLLDPTGGLDVELRPGGMGKTTLAQFVRTQLSGAFPDGVLFGDLTPLTEPTLIPEQIIQMLGLEPEPGFPTKDLLAEYYFNRHALLILDNFEHLLDGASFVAELVQACPQLHVLATSREALRLRGERVYPLPRWANLWTTKRLI